MKFPLFIGILYSTCLLCCCCLHRVSSFVVSPSFITKRSTNHDIPVPNKSLLLSSIDINSNNSANDENQHDEDWLNQKFEKIAQTLRMGIHTNGFVSKDPSWGIECVKATLLVNPSLGLELTEVAHSPTERNQGLVLVSRVSGNAAQATPSGGTTANNNSGPFIQVGDTIVSVSCNANENNQDVTFQEIVTGLDYEATMDAIVRAKTHAQSLAADNTSGEAASISLELNRLVVRAKVQVIVQGAGSQPIHVQGLAGDNLRLLLRRHQLDMINSSSSNCGGEGLCGTCKVQVLEGADTLNKPNTRSTTKKQQQLSSVSSRLACQTIVGANNQEGTVRILLV